MRLNLVLLVAVFLASNTHAMLGGAVAKIFRMPLSQMIRADTKFAVVKLTPDLSINKADWLLAHFRENLNDGIRIASTPSGGKARSTLTLIDIRVPLQLQGQPELQRIFLDKVTGIKGQTPAINAGIWDAVDIKLTKIMVGRDKSIAVNRNIDSRIRDMDLSNRDLLVFRKGDDVIFTFTPTDYSGITIPLTASAMAASLAAMGGMPVSHAHELIVSEASLWIFPYDFPGEFPEPVAAQFWNEGVWHVNALLNELLLDPRVAQPLSTLDNVLLPFIEWMARHDVDWSGTLTELPLDFWSAGHEQLHARVTYETDSGASVFSAQALQPLDVLEWASSALRSPVSYDLSWQGIPVLPGAETPPRRFEDADIVRNRPLLDAYWSALYRSHTVLEAGDYRFPVQDGVQFSILVLGATASIYAPDDYSVTECTENLCNNLVGGGWWAVRTDGPCQVQIYENTNLSQDNQTTRLDWYKGRAQVYGTIDRNRGEQSYFVELREGQPVSIALQPFGAPINSTDYHARIELSRAEAPFLNEPYLATPTDSTPETYMSVQVPSSSEFWQVKVITSHTLKDFDYLMTITRGAIDLPGSTSSGISILSRTKSKSTESTRSARSARSSLLLFTPNRGMITRVVVEQELQEHGRQDVTAAIYGPEGGPVDVVTRQRSPRVTWHEFVPETEGDHSIELQSLHDAANVSVQVWSVPEIKVQGGALTWDTVDSQVYTVSKASSVDGRYRGVRGHKELQGTGGAMSYSVDLGSKSRQLFRLEVDR